MPAHKLAGNEIDWFLSEKLSQDGYNLMLGCFDETGLKMLLKCTCLCLFMQGNMFSRDVWRML